MCDNIQSSTTDSVGQPAFSFSCSHQLVGGLVSERVIESKSDAIEIFADTVHLQLAVVHGHFRVKTRNRVMVLASPLLTVDKQT